MIARSYQGGKELERKYGKGYGNVVTEMIENSMNDEEYDYNYDDEYDNEYDDEQIEETTTEKEQEIEEKQDAVSYDEIYNKIVDLNPDVDNFYYFFQEDVKVKDYPLKLIKKKNPQMHFDLGI